MRKENNSQLSLFDSLFNKPSDDTRAGQKRQRDFRSEPGRDNPTDFGIGQPGQDTVSFDHKPAMLTSMINNQTLIPTLQKLEEDYFTRMINLQKDGMNESQANEIAWPQITKQLDL